MGEGAEVPAGAIGAPVWAPTPEARPGSPVVPSETVTAEQLAARLGVSPWTIYQAVKRGNPPVPAIVVGRRIVFAKARVDALLGIDEG